MESEMQQFLTFLQYVHIINLTNCANDMISQLFSSDGGTHMERSIFLAHIAEDGREQAVIDHLEGTARRSAAFASDFGSGSFGKLVGLAHDIGKTLRPFKSA